MLDDYNGPSYSRPPSWQKTVEKRDGSSITEAVQFTEAGHDTMEPNNVSTQTEEEEKAETGNIKIPLEMIKVIEDALKEEEKSKKVFDKLAPFHIREAARLQLSRTVPVTALPTDALPVQKMVAGPNGRVALLLASTEHETWCSHNAYVVVCHWNKQYSLPQAVCPTSAAWGGQGQLAIASHAGTVDVFHGQQSLSSTQLHEGPVTAIDWFGREIVTSGTDGYVVLSILKGTVLEKQKSIRMAVSDLPRQIRRGAPGSRALGIVSLSRRGRNLLVASETGGIWRLQLPDLTMVPSMATPVPIEEVLLLVDGKIVLKDVDNRVLIMDSDGTVESESLVSSSKWLFTSGGVLILSDEETVTIVETTTLKKLCQTPLKLLSAVSLGLDEFMILNENNELQRPRDIQIDREHIELRYGNQFLWYPSGHHRVEKRYVDCDVCLAGHKVIQRGKYLVRMEFGRCQKPSKDIKCDGKVNVFNGTTPDSRGMDPEDFALLLLHGVRMCCLGSRRSERDRRF